MKHDFLLSLGISALLIIFCIFTVSIIFLFFGQSVSSVNFLSGYVISFVFMLIVSKNFKTALAVHVINFVIIVILAHIFSRTLDFTADVFLYHLPAINLIKSGWNPGDLNTAYLPAHNWIKYFAKGPWIINAVLADFFSNLEASKLLNAFLMYISIIFSYKALKTYINNNMIINITLALIIGFNTVSLVQSFTFLVDGILSSLLIIFISSLILYYKTKKNTYLFIFFMALCLAVNTKLMAIAYILTFGCGALYFLKKDKKYISVLVISVLTSLFVFGFNPYTVNTIKLHNPFYPIGSKNVDILEDSCPKEIRDKFYLTKFAVSLFSESGKLSEKPNLKIPFSVTNKDKQQAHHPQIYMGGFGFLFSGVLLAALFSILLARKKKYYKNFLIIQGILLLSVFINPECWWARFVPQFYLFPVVTAVYLLSDTNDKKYKIAGYILIAAMLLNTLITGFFHYKKVFEHQKIQNELTYNLRHFTGKIFVNKNDPRIDGIRIRLDNAGIKYIETEDNCPGVILKYSTIKLCLIPDKAY